MNRRTLTYGRRKIPYTLVFCARKTMEIAVLPELRVVVKAPSGTDTEAIDAKLKKRAAWIVAQLVFFEKFAPGQSPRHYVRGETHLYLGRRYRLKISEGETEDVKLTRGFLCVTVATRHAEPENVKRLLDAWYAARANSIFSKRLDACLREFDNPARPKLRVRKMKTRWGSLSGTNTMTLNVALVKAPASCIDYVILHELCHLCHKNHGTAFYALLASVCPDWEKTKHKLEMCLI